MIELQDRIKILDESKSKLRAIPESLMLQARAENPWFTIQNITKSIEAICEEYLCREKLTEWIGSVNIASMEPQKIGMVLAGNIPLVGIHDIISVFISGHQSVIKFSDRDKVLGKYFLECLKSISLGTSNYFFEVDRLEKYDAVIATGSNSTISYFKKYFSSVPHVLRGHRNGVGVIYNSTSQKHIELIADDMVSYYGLGCRNISKLYLEEGVDRARVFEALEKYKDISHHNKYKNNYDYAYALYLLNQEEFYTNDFVILRSHADVASRIAVVHYEYFSDKASLENKLLAKNNEIQCVISDVMLDKIDTVFPGKAQKPSLTNYADNIDTLRFLNSLS